MTQTYCICKSVENTVNHHIFRKGIRKRWNELGIEKIMVFWQKNKIGKEISIVIPIDAYVKICPMCHKLIHPENLNYHLNELVVKSLGEKNDTKRKDNN